MTTQPVFYAVEVDIYQPAPPVVALLQGWGTDAWGAPPVSGGISASTGMLRASDVGYRTREADAGGLQVYPPLLDQAFALDRRMDLTPGGSSAAIAYGQVLFENNDRRFDAVAAVSNSDGRSVRIYAGQKTWDVARGIQVDPPLANLSLLFAGIATPWTLSDTQLAIPLRDAGYWIAQPLQSALYSGTGGLNGTADLTGKPIPKTRGGTAGKPVQNITPVLVDATNRIYQYSDAAGTVANLYEGGDTNITFQANVADLYVGTTNAGQYRTCNTLGLFQLGSKPVRPITCDVTGQFPSAGVVTTAVAIARYLLAEDMTLPAGNLDTASFTALDATYNYTAGVYFRDVTTGAAAAAYVLGSLGAQLFPTRAGKLAAMALRAPTGTPAATFTTAQGVSLIPNRLPQQLDPPPYRWRVGYGGNYTLQTTDLAPAITDARRAFLAADYRLAAWSSSAVLTQYRRPNDPERVAGCLLNLADAQAVADALGALWGVRRRLYDLVLPVEIGRVREIGDIVTLRWPVENLAAGSLGIVVGEQIRSGDAVSILQVLV